MRARTGLGLSGGPCTTLRSSAPAFAKPAAAGEGRSLRSTRRPPEPPGPGTGITDRDRRAVAVTEEDDLLKVEAFDDGGEHIERFVVDEGNRPRATHGIGRAIAQPAVNEGAAPAADASGRESRATSRRSPILRARTRSSAHRGAAARPSGIRGAAQELRTSPTRRALLRAPRRGEPPRRRVSRRRRWRACGCPGRSRLRCLRPRPRRRRVSHPA